MNFKTEDIKNYFKEIEIPYDIIDQNMKEILYLFNKIGLSTQFCCEGHEEGDTFEIMLSPFITDEQVNDFLEKIKNSDGKPFYNFRKWNREVSGFKQSGNKILRYEETTMFSNWIFTLDKNWNRTNKEEFVEAIVFDLKEIFSIE